MADLTKLIEWCDHTAEAFDEMSNDMDRDAYEREALACDAAMLREVRAALAMPPAQSDYSLNGSRPLPFDRETGGRMVREAWVRWAQTQPNPKPSWLVPYDELNEADKEADHQIAEAIGRWTIALDAASRAMPPAQGVDASRAVILSDIEQALPRWIEAMGDWDAGGEQAIDEMQATLDDIRALTPPAQEPSHDR